MRRRRNVSISDPNPAYTVQCMSDLHFTDVSATALGYVTTDMARFPTPLAFVATGDITDDATEGQITAAKAWLDGLGPTYYLCCGNHDILNDQTPADFATDFGMTGSSFVVDLGPWVLISLPNKANTEEGISLSADDLTYLDTQLGATAKPCVVLYHTPLDGQPTSIDTARFFGTESPAPGIWNVPNTAAVKAVLADHDNARVWLSGHLHSPYWMPGKVVDLKDVGHSMVHVNLESPYYQQRVQGYNPSDPVTSFYLSVYEGYTEVRVRDHHYRVWRAYYRFPNWQAEA